MSQFAHLLEVEHPYPFDLGRILYFFAERQSILKKKLAGEPRPWSTDPIFNEYRFCNVDRMDDAVTIWIQENIVKPYKDHPDLWLMLAYARWINWPPTLDEMVKSGVWFGDHDHSLDALADAMQARQNRGEKVYTGAYMIRAESNKNSPWFNKSKHWFICNIVIGNLVKHRVELEALLNKIDCTLEEFHAAICFDDRFPNWGGFMTYELVTDLNHTRYLEDAPDRYLWCNPGPGYMRGMNRLTGQPLNKIQNMEDSNVHGRAVLEGVLWAYDTGLIPNDLFERHQLDMRAVESAHCESDKYLRVMNGEGRPRSRYVHHTYNDAIEPSNTQDLQTL